MNTSPSSLRVPSGNAIQTLKSKDAVKVVTVRGTSFEPAAASGGDAAPEPLAVEGVDQAASAYVGQELSKSDRPELTSAGNVVSGGEPSGTAAAGRVGDRA